MNKKILSVSFGLIVLIFVGVLMIMFFVSRYFEGALSSKADNEVISNQNIDTTSIENDINDATIENLDGMFDEIDKDLQQL